MMTVEEFKKKIEITTGRDRYPSTIDFNVDEKNKILTAKIKKQDKLNFMQYDPYTLACIEELYKECGIKVSTVCFIINQSKNFSKKSDPHLNAFIRRISFLNINNDHLNFKIILNDKNESLLDKKSLFEEPIGKIKEENSARQDNTPFKSLEKDFQTFLAPKKISEKDINKRLSILGTDFNKTKLKKNDILREFTIRVFNDNKKSLYLPQWSIDIVSLNNNKEISIIELKFDKKLDIISQILNYTLFFRCYREKLYDTIKTSNDNIRKRIKSKKISCYIASDDFHPKLDSILKFYCTTNKNYGFVLKKIDLGKTMEI